MKTRLIVLLALTQLGCASMRSVRVNNGSRELAPGLTGAQTEKLIGRADRTYYDGQYYFWSWDSSPSPLVVMFDGDRVIKWGFDDAAGARNSAAEASSPPTASSILQTLGAIHTWGHENRQDAYKVQPVRAGSGIVIPSR